MGPSTYLLLSIGIFSSFFVSSISGLPKPNAEHVNLILAVRSLEQIESPNLYARAYVRTTLNPSWTALGETEVLSENEASWRTVFSQDVDSAEGREWSFEVYNQQGDNAVLVGNTEAMSANEFMDENDDSMFIPLLPSGSFLVRSCRTYWNLCGLVPALPA